MQQQTLSPVSTETVAPEMKPEEYNENEEPPSSAAGSRLCVPAFNAALQKSLFDTKSKSYTKKSYSTNPLIRKFRRDFFPDVTDKEWNNWHWQVANRFRKSSQLENILQLSPSEIKAIDRPGMNLPMGITPYYMALVSSQNSHCPIRRSVIPTVDEFVRMPGEADDPLGEENHSPVPGLVHRYPDRVLVLASNFCSTYCRYCTRSRMVGKGHLPLTRTRLKLMTDYVRANPNIRDVLISGGDPLTLSDDKIDEVLHAFRSIDHVEVIRIGTKVPAVLPQRITKNLIRVLKKYHPLWMSLHFIHSGECTPEAYRACSMLADAGIPLGSQTVLLKGINDDAQTIKELMHHLMKMRVRPYYLYQCDPISGSAHFRTSVEQGTQIIRKLRGFTSGYAVPTYVIDAPGGGGKIPVMPDYVSERTSEELILTNYENKSFRYYDPVE